jgi:hypothetical protein
MRTEEHYLALALEDMARDNTGKGHSHFTGNMYKFGFADSPAGKIMVEQEPVRKRNKDGTRGWTARKYYYLNGIKKTRAGVLSEIAYCIHTLNGGE